MSSGESGAGLHDFEVLINLCDIFKCCCLTLRVLRKPLWLGFVILCAMWFCYTDSLNDY